jgi:hypothetical protein
MQIAQAIASEGTELNPKAKSEVKNSLGIYISKNKQANRRALVAHTCNPSYSGGRDQEDSGSTPAQANSS